MTRLSTEPDLHTHVHLRVPWYTPTNQALPQWSKATMWLCLYVGVAGYRDALLPLLSVRTQFHA